MKEVIGTCHFCGQTRWVRVEENLTETEEKKQADYEASIQCTCENSKPWAEMETNINYAQRYIANQLKATAEVKSILHEAVSIIGHGYADKITVQHGEVDFKVYQKKSKILVRKKKVIEEGMTE